ncbi:hypothetical protein LK459_02700 [Gordonia otitidis]|uniref:hypothetical protein n=1 Tax=Gordonia otitidis TaxID=249058 RepID=UPI001D13E514|nr:hypothetical protein [Gordonia otitidis]UEA59814.1 hypothetical protein LK459_02700 [Gordonia otitidis]
MTPSSTPLVLAADQGAVALLTLAIAVYSAAILICIGVGINAISRGRRRLAIVMACCVGVLVIAGVVVAVMSSIH